MRMRGKHRLPQRAERIVGQLVAEHVGQRAQDRPVLARVARRKRGAVRHLHAAFGVDVDRGFFRIGGARQGSHRHDARRGRHACRYRRRRDQARPRLRRRRAGTAHRAPPAAICAASSRPRPARSRDRARATRAAALCRIEKPFQPSLTTPNSTAAFAASEAMAAPSCAPSAPARPGTAAVRLPSALGELAVAEIGERFRAGAEIVIVVGEIGLLADQRRSGTLPARQRLRMRALSTAASRRGLEPIIMIASACSIPAIVELNR